MASILWQLEYNINFMKMVDGNSEKKTIFTEFRYTQTYQTRPSLGLGSCDILELFCSIF